MKVLYNATFARVGGGLTYVVHQAEALAAVPGVDVTVLASPWNHEALVAGIASASDVRRVAVPNVAGRFVWEQVLLPLDARRHDVLLSAGNFGALVSPVPQVMVLQNANYVGHGRRLPQNASARRRAKIWQSHLSMRRADLVVAVSHSLRDEIRAEPTLRRVEVETVQSGAPPADVEAAAAGADAVRALVGDEPYLVSVASDYAHKRLDDLARIVPALQQVPGVPGRVVFAGVVDEARQAELRSAAAPFGDRLVFLGAIADRGLLLALTRAAEASVSTSELEAFPLTPHEAGSVGTHLVISDIAPHREVADGRATFFPLGDTAALLDAVVSTVARPAPAPWSFDRTWAEHGRELAAVLQGVADR